MRQSIKLWMFAAALGIALRFTPLHGWHIAGFFVFSAIVSYSRRFFFASYPEARLVSCLTGKGTTVITGASSGIGRATAQILMRLGNKVVLSARNVPKLEEAIADLPREHHTMGSVEKLDLADISSVKAMAHRLIAKGDPISTLILNAAYHGPLRQTKDGLEYNLGVNHLGHVLLVHQLLPILAPNCRIVVVASDLHHLCKSLRVDDLQYRGREEDYTFMGFTAYNHSKMCNVMFMRHLAELCKGTEMMCVAVHPGTPVESDLMRSNFFSAQLLKSTLLFYFYNVLARKSYHGAQALLHAAFDSHITPKFRNLQPVSANKLVYDRALCKWLWEESCRLVDIDDEWHLQ